MPCRTLFFFALALLTACHKTQVPVVPDMEPAEIRAERGVRLWWFLSPDRHQVSREEFTRRVTLVGVPTLLNSREQCFDTYVRVDWAYVKRSDCYEAPFGRVQGFTFGGPLPPEKKLVVRSKADMMKRLSDAGRPDAAERIAGLVKAHGGRVVMSASGQFDLGDGRVLSLLTGALSESCSGFAGCLKVRTD